MAESAISPQFAWDASKAGRRDSNVGTVTVENCGMEVSLSWEPCIPTTSSLLFLVVRID